MEAKSKLISIKILHTIIWGIFVSMIFYILYSGFNGKINTLTWFSIGAVLGEGVVLAIFRSTCPLTILARKYSDSGKDNFDIYLPNWLAKYNKVIFTSLYMAGVIWVIFRICLS